VEVRLNTKGENKIILGARRSGSKFNITESSIAVHSDRIKKI
jgi:hypothetical protein